MTDSRFNDPGLGEQLRDRAINNVELSHAEWVSRAVDVVHTVALHRGIFTTDDVWAALAQTPLGPPREPRAMGAVMRAAKSQGICAPTDNWFLSRRPACHRRPLRVWKVG